MSADLKIGESATAEFFRLRRIATVDAAWHLGFIAAFGLAGIFGVDALGTNLNRAPAKGMALYLLTMCVAGLAGGVIGRVCGHGVATLVERWDLHRHPRHFEGRAGGA